MSCHFKSTICSGYFKFFNTVTPPLTVEIPFSYFICINRIVFGFLICFHRFIYNFFIFFQIDYKVLYNELLVKI